MREEGRRKGAARAAAQASAPVLSAIAAGAELAERYRGLDTTGTGQGAADQQTTSADEYRRDARWSISDILGIPRTTVELI